MVPYVCYPRFLSYKRKKSGCNKCNRKKLHGNITFMTFNGLYKLTSYFQSTKSLKPWRLQLLKARFPAFLQPLHIIMSSCDEFLMIINLHYFFTDFKCTLWAITTTLWFKKKLCHIYFSSWWMTNWPLTFLSANSSGLQKTCITDNLIIFLSFTDSSNHFVHP